MDSKAIFCRRGIIVINKEGGHLYEYDHSMNFDADDDGGWVTTENGHHVHFTAEGTPDKGNPAVLRKLGFEEAAKKVESTQTKAKSSSPGKKSEPSQHKPAVSQVETTPTHSQETVEKATGGKINGYEAHLVSTSLKRVGSLSEMPVEKQASEFNKAYKEYDLAKKRAKAGAKTGADIDDGSFSKYLDAEGRLLDVTRSIIYKATKDGKGNGVPHSVYDKMRKLRVSGKPQIPAPSALVRDKDKEGYGSWWDY